MIPNTTQIPNNLFNGEMQKMKDTELRVVLIVARKTLGWIENPETGMRKEEDWISHFQLTKFTGKKSRALSTAIDNCIKKGWIEARDNKGSILDTPQKRAGKKIFYRLGEIFLSKVETPAKSAEVSQTPAKSAIAKSAIAKSANDKSNRITKETSLQNIVGKADDVFLFKNKLDEMTKDKQKHIQIIALYWRIKGFNFENKEQYQAALKRELRPARQLVGYSMDRIRETIEWLSEETDINFKLETVHKYIDEDLDNIEPLKIKRNHH